MPINASEERMILNFLYLAPAQPQFSICQQSRQGVSISPLADKEIQTYEADHEVS